MDKEKAGKYRELAYFASAGMSIAFSVFIGLGLGVVLDQRVFGTTPWLTLIGLVFGIAAAFRNIGHVIRKARKY